MLQSKQRRLGVKYFFSFVKALILHLLCLLLYEPLIAQTLFPQVCNPLTRDCCYIRTLLYVIPSF